MPPLCKGGVARPAAPGGLTCRTAFSVSARKIRRFVNPSGRFAASSLYTREPTRLPTFQRESPRRAHIVVNRFPSPVAVPLRTKTTPAKPRHAAHPCPPCVKGGAERSEAGGLPAAPRLPETLRKSGVLSIPQAASRPAPFTQGSQRAYRPFRGHYSGAPTHKGANALSDFSAQIAARTLAHES